MYASLSDKFYYQTTSRANKDGCDLHAPHDSLLQLLDTYSKLAWLNDVWCIEMSSSTLTHEPLSLGNSETSKSLNSAMKT